MKKFFAILLSALTVASFAITVSAETTGANYPSSGVAIPDGSVAITGELIGNETGWDGTEASGRASAFDGDAATYFDPLGVGDGYCGINAGKPYVLTKIAILPRDGWASRYYGASIQGTNTPDDEDSWVDIFMSMEEATEIAWQEILPDAFESDASGKAFQYYRYYNLLSHGDVADVELYGYPEDGVVEATTTSTEATTTEATTTEAAADTAAVEVPDMEAPVLDYPSMDVIANSGAGYDELEAAAAAIGKTAITDVTFVTGSNGNSSEGPENLWDNDVTTKFCTGEFPTQSLAMYSTPITVDGIIMATANDNSSYNNRSPFEWAIYVSADGENWTAIAYGDDTFFEEVDYTYYSAAVATPVSGVKYAYFQSEGALSGCFQVSELVLTGTASEETAPAAEETEAAVEETEAPAETEAAEVVEETVETKAEETTAAPQTFDAGIIAAAAAVVSAAGYAISKKRR